MHQDRQYTHNDNNLGSSVALLNLSLLNLLGNVLVRKEILPWALCSRDNQTTQC